MQIYRLGPDLRLRSMGKTRDRRPPTEPEAIWKEDDVVGGRRVRAMATVLRTSGCWWSRKKGCLMCGYNVASDRSIGAEDLTAQLERVRERFEGEELVKIYTSGSFLDPNEVPLMIREEVFEIFPGEPRILFESRPEFVTDENLRGMPSGRVEVALGLESSSDEVLRVCVRKGFGSADYSRAAETARSQGMAVRTYVLLKPPFMTEAQAIKDAITSCMFARSRSETISINPVNVQAGTEVERLWKRGDYRPPWLWSLVEVLKAGKDGAEARVFSSPSGAATPRGVHNCGRCDHEVLGAVKRFSLSQDLGDLEGLDCPCKEIWRAHLMTQGAMRTSVDVDRHLESDLPFA
jgi:radical SAM enzyme (TIGR01210 family)